MSTCHTESSLGRDGCQIVLSRIVSAVRYNRWSSCLPCPGACSRSASARLFASLYGRSVSRRNYWSEALNCPSDNCRGAEAVVSMYDPWLALSLLSTLRYTHLHAARWGWGKKKKYAEKRKMAHLTAKTTCSFRALACETLLGRDILQTLELYNTFNLDILMPYSSTLLPRTSSSYITTNLLRCYLKTELLYIL